MTSIPIDRRVATASDLARIDASVGERVFVGDFGGFYSAQPRTIGGIDGAEHDQVPITWFAEQNNSVIFSAAEDGTDDWARLQLLCNSIIGQSKTVVLAPGEYNAESSLLLSTGFPNILASDGVRIVADLTRTLSAPTPALFQHYFVSPVSWTTLQAAPKAGATKIRVVSISSPITIAAGSVIEIAASTSEFQTQHRVIGDPVAGSGYYELSLDRPLRSAYPLGAAVYIASPLEGWRFDGGGCSISGIASRYFSIMRGWGCRVSNIVFDDADGTPSDVFSWDVACVRCVGENLEFREVNGEVPLTGFFMAESSDGIEYINCHSGAFPPSAIGRGSFTADCCVGLRISSCSGSDVIISAEQSVVSIGNTVEHCEFSNARFGQSTESRTVDGALFNDVKFRSSRAASDPTNIVTVACAAQVTFRNCSWITPDIRTNCVSVTASGSRLSFDAISVGNGYTSYVGLGDSDVNRFISIASADAVTSCDCVIYGGSVIRGCELTNVNGASTTFNLTMRDTLIDMAHVASAALGTFRYSSQYFNARLYNITTIAGHGAYSAIAQTPAASNVLVQDSILEGAWYTISGTCTGYKRGQTTLSTTGGTWTTTAF